MIDRGLSPADARVEALRRLGGAVSEVRETLRRSAERRELRKRWNEWPRDLAQDVRYASRALRRRPAFTVAAGLCLAIGIGANSAMFSIVDSLLLRPPAGVRDPAGLLWINAQRTNPLGFTDLSGLSYPDYLELSRTAFFAQTAAYSNREDVFEETGSARKIASLAVTPTFMPLLGVQPMIGRFFATEDDQFGSTPTVVLGYEMWQSAFGGAPDAIGKRVRIGATSFIVIGVTPPGFNGVERARVDVYVPTLAGAADSSGVLSQRMSWLTMLTRARRDAPKQIAEKLDLRYHQIGGPSQSRASRKIVVAAPMSVVAMRNSVAVQNTTIALWLMGVAAIVLMVACANVAGLLLTRAARRRHEISIRLALGITRLRLMRLLLTEGVVIAIVGALGGLGIAYWGGGLLSASLLERGGLSASVFDSRVLAATFIITAVAAIACGLLPALHVARHDISHAMKTGEQGTDVRVEQALSVLLVGQIALTLVLLVGAGLFVRSLHNLNVLDLGFDVQQSLRARLKSPPGATALEADAMAHRVRDAVSKLPGVERAAVATAGPFGNGMWRPVFLSDRSPEASQLTPGMSAVTPGFFSTLGIKLLRGRDFTDADRLGTESVVIVNQAMATHLWPGKNPLGQCVRVGVASAPCSTVIGVVSNARQGNIVRQSIQYERIRDGYYLPLEQQPPEARFGLFGVVLYVRSSNGAVALVPAVRRLLSTEMPGTGVPDVVAFETAVEPQIRPWRIGVLMFGVFGVIALLLAIVGIHGMLAFRVAQRRREIGVRVALGATALDIYRSIVGQGARLAVMGVAIGLVASLTVGHALGAMLFGVSPRDPIVLASIGLVLLCTAIVASFLPARSAVRIDPVGALRDL
jgi:predicted permease